MIKENSDLPSLNCSSKKTLAEDAATSVAITPSNNFIFVILWNKKNSDQLFDILKYACDYDNLFRNKSKAKNTCKRFQI